jgi:hypothetical protein
MAILSLIMKLATISIAADWIEDLRKTAISKKYGWSEPFISIQRSELALEWWHGDRKITVYFSDTSIDFIKVWGPDVDNEMAEGTIETSDQLEDLWKWLVL